MNLVATLLLNTSQFQSGARGAENSLGQFRSSIGPVIARLAALAATALSVRAVLARLGEDGRLHLLAAQAGMSVRSLVVLRQAFDDTGVGAENLEPTIAFLNRALSGLDEAGNRTAPIFDRLGLSMDALRTMDPTDQVKTIGEAIMRLGSHADRTDAVMKIFGRSGVRMLALFANSDAIDTAGAALDRLAGHLEVNSRAMDAAGDAVAHARRNLGGFTSAVAAGAAPAVRDFAETLTSVNTIDFGSRIGAHLALIVRALDRLATGGRESGSALGTAAATGGRLVAALMAVGATRKVLAPLTSSIWAKTAAIKAATVASATMGKTMAAALLPAMKILGPLALAYAGISFVMGRVSRAAEMEGMSAAAANVADYVDESVRAFRDQAAAIDTVADKERLLAQVALERERITTRFQRHQMESPEVQEWFRFDDVLRDIREKLIGVSDEALRAREALRLEQANREVNQPVLRRLDRDESEMDQKTAFQMDMISASRDPARQVDLIRNRMALLNRDALALSVTMDEAMAPDKLADLVAQYQSAMADLRSLRLQEAQINARMESNDAGGGPGTPAAMIRHDPLAPFVDRLTRAGAMLGGGGSPNQDVARRQVSLAERQVRLLEGIARDLSIGNRSQNAAVFAA